MREGEGTGQRDKREETLFRGVRGTLVRAIEGEEERRERGRKRGRKREGGGTEEGRRRGERRTEEGRKRGLVRVMRGMLVLLVMLR